MPSPEAGPELRCILVVEDDTMVRETIEAMLEGHYRMMMAESAEQAVAQLETVASGIGEKPDLILLDCLLPGGGLSRVLQAADLQSIPVVLTSGDPERATRIDPGRRFLAKPFNQTTLLQVLRAIRG